jgi:FkbM family methyltransferase
MNKPIILKKFKQIKVVRFLLLPIYKLYINFIWYIFSEVGKKNIKISVGGSNEIEFYSIGHIAKELFLGNFEKNETIFFKKNLNINSNILNIGANIGYYTILSAKISKNGLVYSIEPSEKNYNRLINNIKLNQLTNIHTYKYALGQFNDILTLYSDKSNPNLDSHYTLCNENGLNNEIEKVQVLPLDDLLNIFPKFDFVIIDVEGFELNLLLGGAEFLFRNNDSVYMIEVTKNQNEVVELMKNLGFKLYSISNNGELIESILEHGNLIFKK